MTASIWPLLVDGLLTIATVELWKTHRGSGSGRWVAWLAFVFGIRRPASPGWGRNRPAGWRRGHRAPRRLHYAGAEMLVEVTATSLGCGSPLAVAELKTGETVLDLGSGGGLDVLLSARRVGPSGRAVGRDMTDDMLTLACRHAEQVG